MLNAALLVGEDTRRIRAQITALERRAEVLANAEAAGRPKIEHREQQAIAARARQIAAAASARSVATLNGLQPPPMPLPLH
jgi:hypothetical protein